MKVEAMRSWMKWVILMVGGCIYSGGCPRTAPSLPSQQTLAPPRRESPRPASLPPGQEPPSADQLVTVTLYFADSHYTYLVSEKRQVPARQATPAGLLELLLEGPREKGRESVLPSHLKIEGVTTAQGIATVSLPGRLEREVGGENTALLAIQSIIYTLTERRDVKRVQFLIGGRKLPSFAGVLDLSQPQRRDETLLEKR